MSVERGHPDARPNLRGSGSLPWPARLRIWLPKLLILYGVAALCFMTLAMPPFQNPDEPAHFRRAEHISRGHLIGNRYAEYNSGGETDANIGAANAPFYPIPFHSHVKVTREMFAQADLVALHSDYDELASGL